MRRRSISVGLAGFLILICLGCVPAVITPTATLVPSPMPSHPIQNTSAPTQTATSAPTLAPTASFALITPPPASGSETSQLLPSPDGEWIAQASVTLIDIQLHIQVKAFRKNGTKTWTIIDRTQNGQGYEQPQLRHWSHDSQYLYYSQRWIADGACELYPIETTWQKVSLKTGQETPFVLPPGRSHAISPDDSSIAYVNANALLYFYLRDVKSGKEQKVPLPVHAGEARKLLAGDIFWSPDGDAVILTIVRGDFCAGTRLDFSLVHVNLRSLEPIELIPSHPDWLVPLQWVLPNYILLRDWNGYTWWIDATTGQPTTSPQTPVP